MELIKDYVQLGKAVAALGKEDRLYEVVAGLSPEQRASAAAGLMEGLLERGGPSPGWPVAVKLMAGYQPIGGSQIVQELYRPPRDFAVMALEALKRQKDLEEVPADDKTRQAISKMFTGAALREFLRLHTVDDLAALLILEGCPEKERESIRGSLGDRAWDRRDNEWAMRFYIQSGNVIGMGVICAEVVQNPTIEGLRMVYPALENSKRFRETYLADIVGAAAKVRVSPAMKDVEVLGEIMLEYLKKPVPLQDGLADRFLRNAARFIRSNDIQFTVEDKSVALEWAAAHVKDAPAVAYRLFQKYEFKGKERVNAARLCLENGMRRYDGIEKQEKTLDVAEIDLEDLDQIKGAVPLELRLHIERAFKDNVEIQRLARAFYRRGRKAPRGSSPAEDFDVAYRVWMEGGGSCQDPIAYKLRARLMAASSTGAGKAKRIGTSWLAREDVPGHIQVYEAVVDSDPFTAYDLARAIKSRDLMDKALDGMLKISPERALIQLHKRGEPQDREYALGFYSKMQGASSEVLKKGLSAVLR